MPATWDHTRFVQTPTLVSSSTLRGWLRRRLVLRHGSWLLLRKVCISILRNAVSCTHRQRIRRRSRNNLVGRLGRLTLGRHAISRVLRVRSAICYWRVHLRSDNWITRGLLRKTIRHWRCITSPSSKSRASSSTTSIPSARAIVGCFVHTNRSTVKSKAILETSPIHATNQALGP